MKFLNSLFYPLRFLSIKIHGLLVIFKLYKNWLLVIAVRLPLRKFISMIIYELRAGIMILVRTNDVDGRIVDNIFLGEYSYTGFDIKPTDVVIDIGAHIGIFSLFSAVQATHGKIFAYEPQSENFNLLKINTILNQSSNITFENYAISDKKSSMRLYLPSKSKCLANLYHPSPTYETVNTLTLEDIFSEKKISVCNLLKLDCEGAEYDILTSTSPSIFKRIDKIIFEYHLERNKLKNLSNFLEHNHYQLIKEKKYKSNLGIIFFKKREK